MDDKKAIALLKRIADKSPFYASEMGGDIYCFFCGEWQVDENNNPRHDDDCIWIEAVNLLRESAKP